MVSIVQHEIAKECLIPTNNGLEIEGYKDMVDRFDKSKKIESEYEKKHESPFKLSQTEKKARNYLEIITEMRSNYAKAQKENKNVDIAKEELDKAFENYENFLSLPQTRKDFLLQEIKEAQELKIDSPDPKEKDDPRKVAYRNKKIAAAEKNIKIFWKQVKIIKECQRNFLSYGARRLNIKMHLLKENFLVN